MSTRIQIFDTTLRDGEQTPGVNFNKQEKVQIAKQLEAWGVDAIEAGFPASSPGDFEAVEAIANELKNTTVVGLARCNKNDIDRVYEALQDAKDKQIHIFVATSPIHREFKLKKSKAEIIEIARENVRYAKTKFDKVQFSPEDATRTEWEYLAEIIEVAIQEGATIINIPDTVGYSNPVEYGNLFKYLKENVPSFNQVIFSTHTHDDLGLATANALAGIENGALRIEGALNGIGERAGNTALEEIAVALYIRKDFYNFETNIKLAETKKTSDLVSRLSGMVVPRNKAIVGANAYAHESGIHQDGVLKKPETYEIITPQLVGVSTNELPLGKLSGRHAFVNRMESMGYDMSNEEEVSEAFQAFKNLADKKKVVLDSDLHAIMTGQNLESNARYELIDLAIEFNIKNNNTGKIVLKDNENPSKELVENIKGQGSVDAIFDGIHSLLSQGQSYELVEYSLEAITAGTDAQAQVNVVLRHPDGTIHNGTGIDYDVLISSAKAYLDAFE